MVSEQTPLVPAHAQMIDEDIACYGRLGRGVEGALERC